MAPGIDMIGFYRCKPDAQSGFTLIELMITMLISAIVIAGIYSAYTNQMASYNIQEEVAVVQQNIRAAMMIMVRDIREAGCDPTESLNAGIVTATMGQIRFTRDMAGDPISPNEGNGALDSPGEDLTFGFSPAVDVDGNGVADGGTQGADWSAPGNFGRDTNTGGGFQPIAESVDAVEFNYILSDGTSSTAPAPSMFNAIRAVQISMLVRSQQRDRKFINTTVYTTASGTIWGPFSDNFRRRFAATTIQCRNLGL
jgi:type IV pilus assembly protein PilW